MVIPALDGHAIVQGQTCLHKGHATCLQEMAEETYVQHESSPNFPHVNTLAGGKYNNQEHIFQIR
jgi:hypothetical protein